MGSSSRTAWTSSLARMDEMGEPVVRKGVPIDPDLGMPDPYADEPKWAAWKVTLVVVAGCAAFWGGISFLAVQLLG